MHLDGIHLHRATVVLIAVSGGHVVGWHVARSETCSAWSSLLSRIAPPHRRASRTSEQPPSGWRRTTSESGTSPDSSTRRAVGRRHHRGPAHAPGQDSPDGARTDQGWAAIHVPRPAGRVRGADPVLEQTHRVVERAHPRHAAPPPRPVPSAADQGDLLVVPPAH